MLKGTLYMNYDDYNKLFEELKKTEKSESFFLWIKKPLIVIFIYGIMGLATWFMFGIINEDNSFEKISACFALISVLFSLVSLLIISFDYKNKNENKTGIKRIMLYLTLLASTNFQISNKDSSLEVKKMEVLMKEEMRNILNPKKRK
jgi:uncharacterized ion transporter superfamily protein YfcC